MASISYRNRNKGKLDSDGRTKKANWEYRFFGASINGVAQRFEKSGFRTKDDAIKAGTQAFNEYMNGGSVFVASDVSYSDCLDSWMENYVAIRCNVTTREGYESRINYYIRPALGKYKLTALKRDSIQKFINNMYFKRFSRNTLTSLLGIITSSLRYAKRQGWIQTSPADDIDLPATRECGDLRHKERDAIPREVMAKVFERFPEGHPSHLPMMLAYHCGLRLGEVFGLSWDDVDLKEGMLLVQRQAQRYDRAKCWRLVPPKYNSIRRIRMDNVMLELLKREWKRQESGRFQYGEKYSQLYIDEDSYLNTENRGEPINMVNRRVDGTYVQARTTLNTSTVIRKEIGYQAFDFHSLRHTHATELCEAGVNLKEIQRRLGHKTLEVTNRRYIHATELMETQSLDIMNSMYEQKGDDEPPRQAVGLYLVK